MIYLLIPFAAALFALFPLTDTDIWWHLACGREWVVTWTPMREGLLNIHAYFQQFVFAIYSLGGAPLLVLIKCVLWFFVFFLFVLPSTKRKNHLLPITLFVLLLFVCRFLLEMRPVVISMICLGVIWKIVPRMNNRRSFFVGGIVLLLMQWFWCRFQGLFVLGPILCAIIFFTNFKKVQHVRAKLLLCLAMLLVPLLHEGGLAFLRYPLELFDRLVGLSSESEIFSSAIAENRSPLTLLLKGENLINSLLMIVCCVESVVLGIYTALRKKSEDLYKIVWLVIMAMLALVGERNFVLMLPVFCSVHLNILERVDMSKWNRLLKAICLILIFAIAGLWCKSLQQYDATMVSFQRVPVDAVEWMKKNPHKGRLFNDDRAGGYLAFMNPSDSIYMDGRFIQKTSSFFKRYLQYAESPEMFLADADSMNVDRVILPLRYYARWQKLIVALQTQSDWSQVYLDDFYCIYDRSAAYQKKDIQNTFEFIKVRL